jgi:nitroimidazol reductase NimA-like FMN-containing flavoprotein (pyridoxamine 5'-phosphate oxidase superfamily)
VRIHELTDAESAAVVGRSKLGRLACARNDQPYIVPIHFNFDADRRCLYAFSSVGQKIQWMRENPKVCVEVDEITDKDHWTTVLIFGGYEELGDSPDDRAARQRAQEFFESRPEWWLPAAAKTTSREPHAIVVYRIRIDRLSGRQAARSGL